MLSDLSQIKNIPESAVTLLQALGIVSIKELSQQDFFILHERLVRMNELRPLRSGSLTTDEVAQWIMAAKTYLEKQHTSEQQTSTNNTDDIPEAILLDDYLPEPKRQVASTPLPKEGSGRRDLEIKPVLPEPHPRRSRTTEVSPTVTSPVGSVYVSEPDRKEIQTQFRSMAAYQLGKTGGISPLKRKRSKAKPQTQSETEHDEHTEELTNKSSARRRDVPQGRWHKKGVNYPNKMRFHLAATIVLIFKLLLPCVLIGLPLVIYPAMFANNRQPLFYFLPVVGICFFFGLLYLLYAMRVRCRVCTNHFFLSKHCLKHVKSHHLFGWGHSFFLAIHGLLFGWMRCMYCGTAIRVRR